MSTSTLVETGTRFRADPATARTSPSVTATLANGHARLTAGPFNWESDLPNALGGGNLAPSPTAYLLGALAGCGVAFLHDTLAPEFGVRIDGITAVARCKADMAGLVGIAGALPNLTDIELEVEVSTPDSEATTSPMFAAWRERCPIYLALLTPNTIALNLSARSS